MPRMAVPHTARAWTEKANAMSATRMGASVLNELLTRRPLIASHSSSGTDSRGVYRRGRHGPPTGLIARDERAIGQWT